MTTHGPARPPTFRWESDCDWSGRPFPARNAYGAAPTAPARDDVDPTEVTLPAVTTGSWSSSPAAGQEAAPAGTGPDPSRPSATPALEVEGEVVEADVDSAGVEGTGHLEEPRPSPNAAAAPRATASGDIGSRAGAGRVEPPAAQVLAEDVFAGLLDVPAEPVRALDSDDDQPTEIASSPGPTERTGPAERTDVVGAELALTDPDGAALAAAGRGATVARQVWSRVCHVAPGLGREDASAAVASGELAYLRALIDPRGEVRDRAGAHAGQAAERSATRMVAVLSRGGRDHTEPRGQASWQRAGTVIPVLGAGTGVGASVTSAAVFDALDAAGIPTLLVDAAEPARSGLTRATGHPGNAADRRPHPDVGIAFAPRGGGWVAALSAPPDELLTDAVVPDPSWWLPLRAIPAVTVVDLGWDPWQTAAAPLRGPGVWLEAGDPPPHPLVVTTATRPGVLKARELLDRLRPWCDRGVIAAPAGLVVTGARRWPREVRPVALRHLGALAEQAVLLPHDRTVALGGVGPDRVPARLRTPFAPVLRRWGLPVSAAPAPGRFLRGH